MRSYAVFKCNCCGSRVQINFDLQKSGMFKIIVSRDSFPPSHCQTILSARNRKEIVSTLNSQEPINPTSKNQHEQITLTGLNSKDDSMIKIVFQSLELAIL